MGPTAVGKTELSLALAEKLNAEIVSCDSMQVYRDMTVLTQAATLEQRAQVPHHMVEVVEPETEYNAADYCSGAAAAIREISAREKNILITGGTGLYLNALTEGLCDAPPADEAVRQQLEIELRESGAEALYSKLLSVDPVAAAGIHANDTRRVIRALEVNLISGQPLSAWWASHQSTLEPLPILTAVITRDRGVLYERINRRLITMLECEGLLEEAEPLLKRKLSQTAWQVHGLRHIRAYITGERSKADMIETWQQEVRNYAKRQLTWFRNRIEAQWVELDNNQTLEEACSKVLHAYNSITNN